MKTKLKEGIQNLLDVVYPRQCVGCGKSSPKTFRFICWECWSETTRVEMPFCNRCGDPVAGTIEHQFVCYTCTSIEPVFAAARSATRYSGVVADSLRQLKYNNALWLAPDLAKVMFRCVDAEFSEQKFDLIVPVPLHHIRRRERGYNQSDMLAKELGRLMEVTCRASMLRRIRPTTTQTNLTAKDRLSNVANAFKSRESDCLSGRHVLLVDDVMTTGATINACSKALKKGGAASVHAITVARG